MDEVVFFVLFQEGYVFVYQGIEQDYVWFGVFEVVGIVEGLYYGGQVVVINLLYVLVEGCLFVGQWFKVYYFVGRIIGLLVVDVDQVDQVVQLVVCCVYGGFLG